MKSRNTVRLSVEVLEAMVLPAVSANVPLQLPALVSFAERSVPNETVRQGQANVLVADFTVRTDRIAAVRAIDLSSPGGISTNFGNLTLWGDVDGIAANGCERQLRTAVRRSATDAVFSFRSPTWFLRPMHMQVKSDIAPEAIGSAQTLNVKRVDAVFGRFSIPAPFVRLRHAPSSLISVEVQPMDFFVSQKMIGTLWNVSRGQSNVTLARFETASTVRDGRLTAASFTITNPTLAENFSVWIDKVGNDGIVDTVVAKGLKPDANGHLTLTNFTADVTMPPNQPLTWELHADISPTAPTGSRFQATMDTQGFSAQDVRQNIPVSQDHMRVFATQPATFQVVTGARPSITLSAPQTVQQGGVLSYFILVSNTGAESLTGTNVSISTTNGTVFDPSSSDANAVLRGRTVIVSVGTLLPGMTRVVQVGYVVADPVQGVVAQAIVAYDQGSLTSNIVVTRVV